MFVVVGRITKSAVQIFDGNSDERMTDVSRLLDDDHIGCGGYDVQLRPYCLAYTIPRQLPPLLTFNTTELLSYIHYFVVRGRLNYSSKFIRQFAKQDRGRHYHPLS